MSFGVVHRTLAAAAVVMLAMSWQLAAGSAHVLSRAWAYAPLPIDPSMLPGPHTPAPLEPTEQKEVCRYPGTDPGRDINKVPTQQRGLDLPLVWQLTRGAGQTVAVIDTGVARHPRLPPLIPGGDYVFTGDGTQDCDAHGTLVAGIIAASPDPTGASAFSGIAPDVSLITIRQSSNKFAPVQGAGGDNNDPSKISGVGNVETLAMAVRTAADMGATVINISEVACSPAKYFLDDRALGAALQYAVDEKNVVVVAAAGNVGDGQCKNQNPPPDPARPNTPDWDSIQESVSPGWYNDLVLTVGSIGPAGQPSEFSLGGPWVDVSAPGESVISIDPARDSLVNAYVGEQGMVPIQGTSFSAPVVSGVAALVRSRFPQLSAREVMERIKNTAHHPPGGWDPYLGFGVVDALAAVSDDLATTSELARANAAKKLNPPPGPPPADPRPKRVALIGIAACAAFLAAALAMLGPVRRLREEREGKTD